MAFHLSGFEAVMAPTTPLIDLIDYPMGFLFAETLPRSFNPPIQGHSAQVFRLGQNPGGTTSILEFD